VALRSEEGVAPSFRCVLEVRQQGRIWALRLEGIEDRNAAKELVGCEVLARREDLGEAGEGQHWWDDLEGLPVWSKGGELLGNVVGFYATGGTDVLVVMGDQGEKLIPLAPYVVIDSKAGRITVDPPEGLLDIEDKGRRST
jgi:16S rRNA processing protein RimM